MDKENYRNTENIWDNIAAIAKEANLDIDVDAHVFDPKLDFVFKAIFTHNSEESKTALVDLLNSLLDDQKIKTVTISNNELPVTGVGEKNSTMDVHVSSENGDECNVEIQVKQKDNIINRSEYSVCKLFATQNAKGKRYDDLHKVYEIMITNFTLFPDKKEFISEYQYRSKSGSDLSGNTRIIFIELTKLKDIIKKPVEDMTDAEMWAIFLKYASNKKAGKLVSKIKEKREGIRMAGAILNTISANRAEQIRYINQLKFEMDQISQLHYAEKKGEKRGERRGEKRGVKRGVKKGEAKGKSELVAGVRNMIATGLQFFDIAKLLGFEENYIQKIISLINEYPNSSNLDIAYKLLELV